MRYSFLLITLFLVHALCATLSKNINFQKQINIHDSITKKEIIESDTIIWNNNYAYSQKHKLIVEKYAHDNPLSNSTSEWIKLYMPHITKHKNSINSIFYHSLDSKSRSKLIKNNKHEAFILFAIINAQGQMITKGIQIPQKDNQDLLTSYDIYHIVNNLKLKLQFQSPKMINKGLKYVSFAIPIRIDELKTFNESSLPKENHATRNN